MARTKLSTQEIKQVIQSGNSTASISTTASTIAVVFDKPYSTIPHVYACARGSAVQSLSTIWSINNVSTTGFDLIGKAVTGSGTAGYSWTAIGDIE